MPKRILLTNDDGIHAKGINALAAQLRRIFEVVVVAPASEQSECSHSVTTKRALQGDSRDGDFAVHGTPVDCVRLGVCELVTDIDLVISGINHGGNLGTDIFMSGTVAAAREACMRGIPAIAVSQYRRADITEDWSRSARFAVAAIQHQIGSDSYTKSLTNINLPATEAEEMPELCVCELDTNPMPVGYRNDGDGYRFYGAYHDRPRSKGSDVDECFGGKISISLL